MRKHTLVTLATVALAALAAGVLIALFVTGGDDGDTGPTALGPETTPATDGSGDVVSAVRREDSHVLGEEGASGVTLVEFLDFECEACAAAYPVVESLREEYAGEVTFVLRYYPLPGHPNSVPAAHAVEAAALQGELEAMYALMYESQNRWSHQQEPQDAVFRSFAAQIGLDLEQYDADVVSPEVADRVARDIADGESLGVGGTPTFYLDDELFQPTTVDDLGAALDEALAR